MTGFFKAGNKELATPVRTTGCASCGLASGCLHPKMEPTGEGRKKILIIAEAPGETEDKTGTQLIGKVGQRVRSTLRAMGIDLDKDCRKTNGLRCRPPGNRTPEPNEIAACRHHIFEEITKYKPKLIILFGGPAVLSLLGGRWQHDSDFSITRWRGLTIPDHELGAWICPTFHPSYVERTESQTPAVDVIWRRDIQRALDLLSKPLPKRPDPEIRFLSGDEIEQYLLGLWRKGKSREMVGSTLPYAGLKPGTHEWIICWKAHPQLQKDMIRYQEAGEIPPTLAKGQPLTIAMDYETTGLKPYHPDHRIVCCSIAESPDKAVSWMWDKKAEAIFRELMLLYQVRKIGANIKFEQVWSRTKLGHPINGWWWDTVNAAHVWDNRKGNASVAFQVYTRLGVLDFKSDTDPYLKAADSNDFNQIDKAPRKSLLTRNALDSAHEYGVCLRQREEFGYERCQRMATN